jgi:chaperonin GroES
MASLTKSPMKTKSKIKILPLADRVVVRALEEDSEKTRGGLYIPDTAKEKPQQGRIIAVGPGRFEKGERVPMELKQGGVGSSCPPGPFDHSKLLIVDEGLVPGGLGQLGSEELSSELRVQSRVV